MQNIIEISSFMDKYLVAKDKNFLRFGILPVEATIETIVEIKSLPMRDKTPPALAAFGQLVDCHSTRLHTFVKHGTTCACCKIQAAFFAVEICIPDKNKVVILNLYAIGEDGEEILMNMDHRLPRAHGGADHVDNMQTMCQPCNLAKGCKMIFTEGGVSKTEIIEKNNLNRKLNQRRQQEAFLNRSVQKAKLNNNSM